MLLTLAQDFQDQAQRLVLGSFYCCLVLMIPIVVFYYIAYERGAEWYRSKFLAQVVLPFTLAPVGWLTGLCLIVAAFVARSVSSPFGNRVLLSIVLHSDSSNSRFAKSFYRASQLHMLCRRLWPWWMHSVGVPDSDMLLAAKLGLLSAAIAPRLSSYSVACHGMLLRVSSLPKSDQVFVVRHFLEDKRAVDEAASILFTHLVGIIDSTSDSSELSAIAAAFASCQGNRSLETLPFAIGLIKDARNKGGPSLHSLNACDLRGVNVLLIQYLARVLGWDGSVSELAFFSEWCRLRDEAAAEHRRTLENRLASEREFRWKLAAEKSSAVLPDLLRRWKELQMFPTHPDRPSLAARICFAYAELGDVSQFHKWTNDAFMCAGILGVQEDKTEASVRFLGTLVDNDFDPEFSKKANLRGLVGALQHTILSGISSESSFWIKIRMMLAYYRGAKGSNLPMSFDTVRIDFATQIQNARQHLESGEHIGRYALVCIQNGWLGVVAQSVEEIAVAGFLDASPQSKMMSGL